MKKILVCYFSASGKTESIAEKIAFTTNSDLFEIEPVEEYTNDDLDWTNKESRSSLEMQDKTVRPSVKSKIDNIENYDTIILGYPIWWYTAPTIINTFIEENNLENKDIYLFATSGSSEVAGSLNDLKTQYPKLNFITAKRFNGNEVDDEYKSWLK